MSDLRTKLIRLAYTNLELQEHLLPILKEARSWATKAFYERMRFGFPTWLVMANKKIEFATHSNMKLIDSPQCLGYIEELGRDKNKTYVGFYIDRERDEKVNVGGSRKLGQAANAIHKGHAEELRIRKDVVAQLERELKRHDWYADFSDDGRVWRGAQAHMKQIKALMAQVDEDVAQRLWDKYSPKD